MEATVTSKAGKIVEHRILHAPVGACDWTLVLSFGLFWLIDDYDADPILGLLVSTLANGMVLNVASKPE